MSGPPRRSGVCRAGAARGADPGRSVLARALAVAGTFDRELVHEIGRITGREARALGYTNVYSPILDLARDPRWGRTIESYGEDPFLVGELGFEQVRGIQAQRVVSTVKHFAVYGVPKGGRDGVGITTVASSAPRTLRAKASTTRPRVSITPEMPLLAERTTGSPVSTFGGHAYDAFQILVGAIERAGSTEPEAIRDAIEATQGFVGTAGVVNMTPEDHLGLDLTAFRMLEIRDGDWTVVE